jgi:hypothetical protein
MCKCSDAHLVPFGRQASCELIGFDLGAARTIRGDDDEDPER